MNKYAIEGKTIENIIGFIKNKSIVIPEMQRPFVWKNTQVRDLIDSLYEEYPVGYLVVWQNPDVHDKATGALSVGKQVLIDGQQRVTALMAAICGEKVLDDDFKEKNIKIAYNPFPAEGENRFEVLTAAISKDRRWIPDISVMFKSDFGQWKFVKDYASANPEHTEDEVFNAIQSVMNIKNRQIGLIVLDKDLSIDIVTEIFIRINSKGTALNQADFVMSTLAADDKYGGNLLRKSIDYFCHLAADDSFQRQIDKDDSFKNSEYYNAIKWAANGNMRIYSPAFDDVIRVAFISQYERGKLANLVDLLHGRNFKTMSYEEAIIEESFSRFAEGVKGFHNRYAFEQFQDAIMSAGFIKDDMIRSRMAMDFAYALFLRLYSSSPSIDMNTIVHYVRTWFAMSVLTGRYTGSPESVMDKDLRSIKDNGFEVCLAEVLANLSDTFWTITLPQNLQTASATAPAFLCFLAAQCKSNDDGFLGSGQKVRELLETGDVHHLFPKGYLMESGIRDKRDYNQVANYIVLNRPTNVAIGKKAPAVYMHEIVDALQTGKSSKYTCINTMEDLQTNMQVNCIPTNFIDMEHASYDCFIHERQQLMAAKIRKWFESL